MKIMRRKPDPHYLGATFIKGSAGGVSIEGARSGDGHTVNVTIDGDGRYQLTCNDCPHTESGTWPQGGGRS